SNTVEPYQIIENNISTIEHAPINRNLPLKVLFHGYGAHKDHDPNPQIRPNYLSIGYNVISIDYSRAVRKPCYPQATAAVRTIGRCIGEFIPLLLKYNEKVELEGIHFIAFSLGAHVATTAGAILNEMGVLIP
ncbi:hydrolase, partial [Oryctes borbonicus]